MLLTRRGILVLVIGAGSVVLAQRSSQPVLLSLMFLSASALIVSAIVQSRMGRGLTLDREVPPEVFAGDPLPVRLSVINTGQPKTMFYLADRPRVRGAETVVSVPVDRLGAGARRDLRWEMPTARRGVVKFGRVTIESRAPFGLLESRRESDAPGTTVILPRPGLVFDWSAPGGRRHSGVGVESLDRSGATREFHSVREYRPEDPMKFVHWKLTARAGKLMVREFQTTSSLEVEVVPNATKGDYRGPAAEPMLEGVVALTATLCADLLRRGCFVRLWSPGRTIRATALDAGPAHLKRLLVELAGLEAEREASYADTIGGIAGSFAARAAVVCVTPYHALSETASAVAGLGERLFSPQLMVMEPPRAAEAEGIFAHDDAILGLMARSRAPGFRFRADDDFAVIRMREHAAADVGFRGTRLAPPAGSVPPTPAVSPGLSGQEPV